MSTPKTRQRTGSSPAVYQTTANTTRTTTTTTPNTASLADRQVKTHRDSSALTQAPSMSFPIKRHEWLASVLHVEKTGVPPLHHAILQADLKIARSLALAGANPLETIKPPLKQSLALDAGGQPILDLISAATKRDADISNPTLIQFIDSQKSQAPQGQLSFVGAHALTLFVLTGQDSTEFLPPLCKAALKQHKDALNTQDALGRTALCLAAESGDLAAIRTLAKHGVDLNRCNAQGKTPMFCAAESGQAKAITLLCELGADATLLCQNQSVAGIALSRRHLPVLIALEEALGRKDSGVLRSLQKQVKHTYAQASLEEFEKFLDFSSPLLTPNRVYRLGMTLASHDDRADKLAALLKRPMHSKEEDCTLGLLGAAALNNQRANFVWLVSYSDSIKHLIWSNQKPSPADQVKLNLLLAMAIQVSVKALVETLFQRGAVIHFSDPAFKDFWLAQIITLYFDKENAEQILLARSTEHYATDTYFAPRCGFREFMGATSESVLLNLFESFPPELHLHFDERRVLLLHALTHRMPEAFNVLVRIDQQRLKARELFPLELGLAGIASGNLDMLLLAVESGARFDKSSVSVLEQQKHRPFCFAAAEYIKARPELML